MLQAIDFLNTFSKNNTGYFEILDNGIEFKNSTSSLDESKTVIVDKKIIQNHTIPHREVFGFDISIFKGLVGILIDDSFDLYVEQDSEDLDTFLCYILDTHNKNIMALDVYK